MLQVLQYKAMQISGDAAITLEEPLSLSISQNTKSSLNLTITKDIPCNITIESRASLKAHIIHKKDSKADVVITIHKDADAEIVESFLDGSSTQTSHIELVGTGASVRVSQVVFGSGNDKIDIHTIAHHQVQDTESKIDIRVLADGASQISAIGDIRIDADAKGSVAHLTDHALILSKDARAHASPAMEVVADDVVASHAASTQRISPEQIFYLEQRGIQGADAKQMIAVGFAKSILLDLPFQDVVMDGLQQQWDRSRLPK